MIIRKECQSERYFYAEDLFPGLFLPVLGRAGESLKSRCEWRRGVSKLLLAQPSFYLSSHKLNAKTELS